MEGSSSFGRYAVLELLAEGGSSSVYRAQDAVLGVERAVKVLGRAWALDASMRERFEREARLLARIRHPNVVAVHDLGEAAGRPYMVLDLLRGGTLETRLHAAGVYAPVEAAGIAQGVLDALHAVHVEGIVHRDVKPANVLLDDRGTPCLTDFGIARVADVSANPTRTGTRLGTFAYMAPEQLDDPRSVDARADVFAVGATLFTLVTGEIPFGLLDGERRAELLARVPDVLRPVVDRATQSRPEARYATAAEMAAALAPPPPAPVQASRPRGSLAAALALGLLVGGGGAWGLLRADRAGAPSEPAAAPIQLEATVPPPPTSPSEPSPPVVVATAEFAPAPTHEAPTAPAPARPVAAPRSTTSSRTAPPEPAPPAPSAATDATAAPTLHTLKVNSIPWSEVSVNGRPKGRTPWEGGLAAGTHAVRLVGSEGSVVESAILVGAGAPAIYCWDHRSKAECSR